MALNARLGNEDVIAKIENILTEISENLLRGEPMSIPLKYKGSASIHSNNDTATLACVSFPGRTPEEAKRFNTALFGSQNVVDKYIDVFAYTFGVQRASLNVVSGKIYPQK
ncbi:endodeoxyribonuclease [Lecanora helva]